MIGSISQFRMTLIASTLLVGTVGSAGAQTVLMVNFEGTLNNDATTRIVGWFQFDRNKPVDRRLGNIIIPGQFTYTSSYFTRLLNYTATKNNTPTDSLPATDGDNCCVLTKLGSSPLTQFNLTINTNTSTVDEVKYVINLKTPDALSQTVLPNCCEFPRYAGSVFPPPPGAGIGTLVKTPVSGSPLTYNIYVTGCTPPCVTRGHDRESDLCPPCDDTQDANQKNPAPNQKNAAPNQKNAAPNQKNAAPAPSPKPAASAPTPKR